MKFIKAIFNLSDGSSKEDRTDAKDKENARLQAENASLKKELEKLTKVNNYLLDDYISSRDENARLYGLWLSSITSAAHANYALVLEELMMKEKRIP